MASCYTRRIDSGLFEHIEAQIRSLDPMSTFALGALTYQADFTPRYFPPYGKEGGFGKTLYYLKGEEEKELSLVFIGEVCPASLGTLLSAKGNHYSGGRSPKPITDDSSVKDIITLRALTYGTDTLQTAFANQLASLEEILNTDADNQDSMGPSTAHVTEFLATSTPDTGSNDRALLKVALPPKYKVPVEATKVESSTRVVHRKVNLVAEASREDGANAVDSDTDTLSDTALDDILPEPEIAIGAMYSPSLLPDYGGTYFQHRLAKLLQSDIRDVDGDLIPPWDMYSKLRPGTIVLVEATLVIWHIPSTGGRDNGQKKVYQIQAHCLRVLDTSDEAVEPRSIPVLRQAIRQTTSASARKAASSAFMGFESPSKKARRS